MNVHTLTPELQDYALIIFMTWCLGSSHLASHIYSRYFVNIIADPLFIQCIVKALICLVAMSVLSINHLFSTTIEWQLASIPVGLSMGWLVVEIELVINRFVQRQMPRRVFKQTSQSHYDYSRTGPGSAILSLAPTYNSHHKTNLKRLHEHYAAHEARQQNFSLAMILAIAIVEEIIFRGYLIQCCYLLPGALSEIALVMSVIIFGISHASFGLRQIIAKIVLGGCCLAAVLICHTVLPALIIHGYLNWVAFRCQSI